MAIWLNETEFPVKHPICWIALEAAIGLVAASAKQLFYTKTVKEILWGYEDPLVEQILDGHKILSKCPVPDGLNAFIQLQVHEFLLNPT